jgi:transposase
MTTSTKAAASVNYTAEQTAAIVALYNEGKTVKTIAEMTGRGLRSLVSKLSAEKVYKAKAKATTKTGEKVESKEQLVEDIAHAMACTSEELNGLEKSNKTTLLRLKAYILAA